MLKRNGESKLNSCFKGEIKYIHRFSILLLEPPLLQWPINVLLSLVHFH